MKKIFALLIFSFIFIGCGTPEKELKLSGGRTVTIETVKESEKDLVLHLSYKNDQKVTKEATVYKEVHDIWAEAKTEAEKQEIDEALIKYIYLAGFDEEHKKPLYEIILFEAAKTENGSWTIVKVN